MAVISVLLMGSFVSGYYYSNIHKNKIIQTDQKKGQMVGNKENSVPSKEIKSQSSNIENATTINNEEKINQVVAVESNQSKIVKSKIYSKENKKIMNKERLNHAHLISNQENNLIPSSEIKMRKRSVNKKEEALKSMIDSKNEEEAIKNTNLIAENTSTNKTEKIVIRKNNELIELEIIGENKVKVEDSKEEIVNEEKGEVKLDLLKELTQICNQ